MKFKLSETCRYWWPVTVRQPDPERAGKFATSTLEVLFEPDTRDQVLADIETLTALATDVERVEHEINRYLRMIADWRNVVDDNDQPVPFSSAALRQALGRNWFREAVDRAFSDSVLGQEARLGN